MTTTRKLVGEVESLRRSGWVALMVELEKKDGAAQGFWSLFSDRRDEKWKGSFGFATRDRARLRELHELILKR